MSFSVLGLGRLFLLGTALCFALSFVLAIVAILRIASSRGALFGYGRAIFALVVSTAMALFLSFFMMAPVAIEPMTPAPSAPRASTNRAPAPSRSVVPAPEIATGPLVRVPIVFHWTTSAKILEPERSALLRLAIESLERQGHRVHGETLVIGADRFTIEISCSEDRTDDVAGWVETLRAALAQTATGHGHAKDAMVIEGAAREWKPKAGPAEAGESTGR